MIAIIAAMQEEVDYLLKKMTHKKERHIAHCHFYEGKISQRKVVLVKSGIGKVNAAIATTLLHEYYEPNHVINTGSAGGYSDVLSVGDVVVSRDVVYHDVDATSFDYAYGQVPGMPERYIADEYLLKVTKQSIRELSLASVQGTIATGDSFMSDENRVNFVRKQIPHLIAVEMEAAAIAQVCYHYQTPFVVIRALSDIAGKKSSITFDQFLKQAAKNSSKIVIGCLNQLS
ncbi:MAG TPA: 5'-methylthioadenosine/S-adenosylhomocysteine nucleosidase [Bacillota bacterium]|nr:5'-methylthioadenosine/S-adenosylhomocysteine nucleosidase [Bacillota bacterium]